MLSENANFAMTVFRNVQPPTKWNKYNQQAFKQHILFWLYIHLSPHLPDEIVACRLTGWTLHLSPDFKLSEQLYEPATAISKKNLKM